MSALTDDKFRNWLVAGRDSADAQVVAAEPADDDDDTEYSYQLGRFSAFQSAIVHYDASREGK